MQLSGFPKRAIEVKFDQKGEICGSKVVSEFQVRCKECKDVTPACRGLSFLNNIFCGALNGVRYAHFKLRWLLELGTRGVAVFAAAPNMGMVRRRLPDMDKVFMASSSCHVPAGTYAMSLSSRIKVVRLLARGLNSGNFVIWQLASESKVNPLIASKL